MPEQYTSNGVTYDRPSVPVMTADSLSTPQKPVVLPTPKVPTPPAQFIQNLQPAIQQSNQGLIQAQTQEAESRNDVLKDLLRVDDPNSQGTYDNRFNQLGGNDYLKQFTDANTRLAQLQGVFDTGSQKVSSAPGQSQVFEGLQLNEVSRQKAVEVGNQALVVQAMQGNIETARQIALDTTRFASEDRASKLQSLMAQFQSLDGIVQGQEKQLIDAQKIKVEQEYEQLKRVQATIDTAIQSGGATAEEMIELSNPSLSDDEKFALAQGIVSRSANQKLTFDQGLATSELGLKYDQFNLDMASDGITVNEDGTFNIPQSATKRDTSWQDLNGKRVLVDNQTGEVITDQASLSSAEPDPMALASTRTTVNQISELFNQASSPKQIGVGANFTRDFLVNPFSAKKTNFIAGIKQITGQLTMDKLIQAKANGATFGALSDGEREMLAQAASKFASWEIKNDKGEVTGYKTDGKSLQAELERINSFAKLDYVKRGGSPEDVGIPAMQDGKYFLEIGGMMQEVTPRQSFNSAGNASASNQVKGYSATAAKAKPIAFQSFVAKKFPEGTEPVKTGAVSNQCGYYARNVVKSMGLTYPGLGDGLNQKRAAVAKYGVPLNKARVGSVLVTAENPTYGHVAVITGIAKNGFVVTESNFKQSERISHNRVIPFNSPKLVGVINPTKG